MDESYKLKIEYVPLDKLKPYERNARKHGDTDIDAIAASIKRFGFKDPIGVWGKNVIVEGHGRLLAAKKLGLAEVPIIRLDDLTDEERRMYALAHNKTAENSLWDWDNLQTELEDLGESFDFSGFGFQFSGTKFGEYKPVEADPEAEPQENKWDDENFKEFQEPLSDEELSSYSENAENVLYKKRVIITYMPEQEEKIKEFLGITQEKMKVVYDFEELNNNE